MSSSSIQAVIDSGNINQLGDAAQKAGLGTMLAYAASKMAYTETGIAATLNVSTLANAPVANGLFKCVVASVSGGSATGPKKLLRGPISGPGAFVPAAGECVWDGGLHVLFSAADLAATASFTYAVATDVASCLLADLPSGKSTL
jgi:hypothetical protein